MYVHVFDPTFIAQPEHALYMHVHVYTTAMQHRMMTSLKIHPVLVCEQKQNDTSHIVKDGKREYYVESRVLLSQPDDFRRFTGCLSSST